MDLRIAVYRSEVTKKQVEDYQEKNLVPRLVARAVLINRQEVLERRGEATGAWVAVPLVEILRPATE